MILKAVGFRSNHRAELVGTLVACHDDGTPLGVEQTGNYSRHAGEMLLKKVEAAGIPRAEAEPKLRQWLADLRQGLETVAAATASGVGDPQAAAHPYQETPEGIVWVKVTNQGMVNVLLCNFAARIVADRAEDDGVESRHVFTIEAALGRRQFRFDVLAEEFARLNWVTERLGASAILAPGFGNRDHARAAIQHLSGQVAEVTVFAHTGWRRANGVSVFLHAAGAIGPVGPVPDVEVSLPENLRAFRLPDPPTGPELVGAIRASLRLLDSAGERVTIPLFAAIWRAVLGAVDLAIHLSGVTGAGKSELAALAQQHFGPGLDARHLPGSWSSTANALESVAFTLKDALCVVDDFAPTGSSTDVQRIHREADRLLRAQGNQAGRQRLRSDASLRPAKSPRGLILSTGEDVPRGQSLQARLMVIEMAKTGPDAVRWDMLDLCQREAAQGLYAQALSGFVRWLSPRYEELRATLREETAALRQQAQAAGQHQRTPNNVAELGVGLRHFLAFAEASGVFTPAEAARLWRRWWDVLTRAGAEQAANQTASDPCRRFLELLAAALASGRCHVASPEGNYPSTPNAWGWRLEEPKGDGLYGAWRPQGQRVGWVDGNDLCLEPDAAYAAAQRLAHEEGDALAVTLPTLKRRLNERGFLASVDNRGGLTRLTVRRTLEGQRREVLFLNSAALSAEKLSQLSHLAQSEAGPGQDGRDFGTETLESRGKLSHETVPFPPETGPIQPELSHQTGPTGAPAVAESGPVGPNGTVGTVSEEVEAADFKKTFGPLEPAQSGDPWDVFFMEGEK